MRALILIAALLAAGSVSNGASNCEGSAIWTSCDVGTDGTKVDVTGTNDTRDTNSTGDDTSTRGDGDSDPDEESDEPEDCGPAGVLCRDGYGVDVIREVTAADLVSFVPARASFLAEPGAVGIVGMPTNFVAEAASQTQTGTLFDLPVTVRFEPAAYVFDYGDGTRTRSTSGGAAWASVGQAQFTATPTSHAYGSRGTFVASVAVEYAASVNFGNGWRAVNGAVTATTGGQPVDIYEARTALVNRTCVENPSGPGC